MVLAFLDVPELVTHVTITNSNIWKFLIVPTNPTKQNESESL